MKNILALLADWANGIFAVLLASWWLGVEPLWWYFLVGMVMSHLPDLDAIPELVRRGKVSASAENAYDHREGLHYPVVILALGGILAYLFPYWGLVLLIALALHLVNDLYGTGWGIKVLWPLSTRNYKLLGRRVNRMKTLLAPEWESLSEPERRLRFIVSWSKEELPSYIKTWGIDEWIEKYYLRLNWISGIEYGLFVVAVVLMIQSLV